MKGQELKEIPLVYQFCD